MNVEFWSGECLLKITMSVLSNEVDTSHMGLFLVKWILKENKNSLSQLH